MKRINDSKLQDSLKQIQLRAQVAFGRTLTHGDMAQLAGVGARSLGDWMRGVTAPIGMSAVFELLSRLPEDDAIAVLNYWRSCPHRKQPQSRRKEVEKSTQPQSVKIAQSRYKEKVLSKKAHNE